MLRGQGSIRLFTFSGINVYLHWSWFLVAVLEIQGGANRYSSIGWNIAEYLALFVIVTLHEFGHALACRQVGGRVDRIVLWPLGGVAYVDPPPRPGATLWSLAAGPLVNVALVPVFALAASVSHSLGWATSMPDAFRLVYWVGWINRWVLVFNILPIYPLDGGQILRSLLWFVLGRGRSLLVATVFGFVGVPIIILVAVVERNEWYGILAIFILMNCWGGLQHARALLRFAKLPRRDGYACPACKNPPPVGELWRCMRCRQSFDTFQTQATCPHCGTQYPATKCLDCGEARPMSQWAAASVTPVGL
jgi:Zn-dependent protease